MSIVGRRQSRRDRGWDNPSVPFLIPRQWTLRGASRKAFAHYFPTFPRSIDDGSSSTDYYAANWLMPAIEGAGQSWATDHRVYGGYLRTRPMPRPPVGGTNYRTTDARWEISQAVEMGLDGFFVDLLTASTTYGPNQQGSLVADQASAVFPGFSVIPMVDASSMGSGTAAANVSDVINMFDGKTSTYHLNDGRLLVGIFAPEACPVAWFQAIVSDYSARYGKTIAWVGCFVDAGANFTTYQSMLYAAGQWGDMGDPVSEQTAPSYMTPIKSAGTKYLGACWPSSYRPKGGWYDEQVNTGSLRAWLNRIVTDQPDMVQLTTWNDFTEGSGFVETPTQGRVAQDLATYSLIKWKTGAFPPIVRDCLYLSHPTRTYGAAVLSPNQTQFMTKRSSSTPASTSNVEVVAFLIQPANVSLTIAGTTTTFSGSQGVNVFSVPITGAIAAGAITANVTRNSQVTASVTATAAVRSSAWNDDHQYMMYSSLRGTTGQFDPTPTTSGTSPVYP